MSIIDAFVSADRGVVCVDTAAGRDGGPYVEISKLVPLPHINAVIAVRGAVLFLAGVVTGAVVTGGNFDELTRQMPSILDLASEKAIALAQQLGPNVMTSEEAGCGEVLIVGFSPERSRVVGHHFRRETLADGFVATKNIVQFVTPTWDDIDLGLAQLRADPNHEGIKALADTQVRLWREREKPAGAAGGQLIYAEVGHDGMSIESVMDFPKYVPVGAGRLDNAGRFTLMEGEAS